MTQILINVIVVTAGTMILVWFGEIITEQKWAMEPHSIFAGIVGLPLAIGQAYATTYLAPLLLLHI